MNFNLTMHLWLVIIICFIYVIDKIITIFGRKNIKLFFHKLFILLFYKNNEYYYKLKRKYKQANKNAKSQELGLVYVSNNYIDDYCAVLNDMGEGVYWRSEYNNRVYCATEFDDNGVALDARDVTDSVIEDIKNLKG